MVKMSRNERFKDKEREVRNDLPTKSQRVRKGMRFYKEK